MRPITSEGFAKPELAAEPGPAPMLQWIAIADLVVDDSYQRPIERSGKRNVKKIAAEFRWSRFAPVVVSPVAGGKFAIVDGQHRTTAALIAGFDQVPCQVIVAEPVEQARAFSAINGNVTRIGALALHRAAVAAGEPAAIAVDTATRKAGVRIVPYPKSELTLEPGETMAVGTIAVCLRAHGEEVVVVALRCIVENRNNVRGGVLAQIVLALCPTVARHPALVKHDPKRLIAAFDRINLIRELSRAQAAERSRGTAIWTVLAGRLETALASALGGGRVVKQLEAAYRLARAA